MDLSGRRALVTGASQGIGRTIAHALADQGASVALAARSDDIYDVASEIGEDQALPVKTDVTKEDLVRSTIDEVVDTFGGLDCLVNNAGIAGPTASVEEVSLADWQRTQDVNVAGVFLMVKHAVTHLRESDNGHIVNLSSISGKRPLEHRTPYVASKMAVIGLTRTLAFELGDDEITVNAICPGATKGPRIRRVIENQAKELGVTDEEAKQQVFTDDAALGNLIDPEDIAEMVVFLTSDRADHITAQDINVDAGTVWY